MQQKYKGNTKEHKGNRGNIEEIQRKYKGNTKGNKGKQRTYRANVKEIQREIKGNREIWKKYTKIQRQHRGK